MTQWVSFAEVKQRVPMYAILQHYGLQDTLRPQGKGDELVGRCPFHEGKGKEPFHVSLFKNAFRCYSPSW